MAKRGNPKWQPGISGNPGGRSSELAAQQSAAKLKAAGLADEALDFLVETLRNKEEATPYRLRAATEILDRGLGKPQQINWPAPGVYRTVRESCCCTVAMPALLRMIPIQCG
jgi:hypothetical protein